MFDHIVVAVGAEELARQVIPHAAAVAAMEDAPVEMVSVVARGSDELPDRRRFLMEAMAEEAGLTGVDKTVVTGWSVAEAVVEHLESRQPALLCVATSVRSRADDLLIGSTVGGILHRAKSPVLVVGHSAREAVGLLEGPAIVCFDGSDESESIVELARAWVGSSGQRPWVVTQIDADAPLDPALEQRGAHQVARTFGDLAEWETLRGSDPGDAIAAFAVERGAGLVMMATHGRSALGRAALGSTAMRVIERAPCPVLVQRPPSLPPQPPATATDADADG